MAGIASRAGTAVLLAALLAGCSAAPVGSAQADEGMGHQGKPAQQASEPLPAQTPSAAPASGSWHAREGVFYQRNWGVDVVGVRRVSSGYMLLFEYRVLDPEKARIFSDKTVKPYLIDVATGTRLAVPAMDNVGELRQSPHLVANRTYFMIFGNPGGLVQSGNRVVVVIGNLRVEGLVVD